MEQPKQGLSPRRPRPFFWFTLPFVAISCHLALTAAAFQVSEQPLIEEIARRFDVLERFGPLFVAFCPHGRTDFRDRGGWCAIAIVGASRPTWQGTVVNKRQGCWPYFSSCLWREGPGLVAHGPGQSHLVTLRLYFQALFPGSGQNPIRFRGSPQAKM